VFAGGLIDREERGGEVSSRKRKEKCISTGKLKLSEPRSHHLGGAKKESSPGKRGTGICSSESGKAEFRDILFQKKFDSSGGGIINCSREGEKGLVREFRVVHAGKKILIPALSREETRDLCVMKFFHSLHGK